MCAGHPLGRRSRCHEGVRGGGRLIWITMLPGHLFTESEPSQKLWLDSGEASMRHGSYARALRCLEDAIVNEHRNGIQGLLDEPKLSEVHSVLTALKGHKTGEIKVSTSTVAALFTKITLTGQRIAMVDVGDC